MSTACSNSTGLCTERVLLHVVRCSCLECFRCVTSLRSIGSEHTQRGHCLSCSASSLSHSMEIVMRKANVILATALCAALFTVPALAKQERHHHGEHDGDGAWHHMDRDGDHDGDRGDRHAHEHGSGQGGGGSTNAGGTGKTGGGTSTAGGGSSGGTSSGFTPSGGTTSSGGGTTSSGFTPSGSTTTGSTATTGN